VFHPKVLASDSLLDFLLTSVVDSNSTRTESCIAIRPDPKAQIKVSALKATDHNGWQQMIRPCRGMKAGLKNPGASWFGLRALLDDVDVRWLVPQGGMLTQLAFLEGEEGRFRAARTGLGGQVRSCRPSTAVRDADLT